MRLHLGEKGVLHVGKAVIAQFHREPKRGWVTDRRLFRQFGDGGEARCGIVGQHDTHDLEFRIGKAAARLHEPVAHRARRLRRGAFSP